MKLVPFEPAHVAKFLNYGGQEHLVLSFRPEELVDLRDRGESWSLEKDENTILGCGGVIKINAYRCCAWGLFQKTPNPTDFLYIHKAVKAGIQRQPYHRIEAFVDPKLFPAMRWIRLLGFTLERAYIPYFFPDGSGASAWAMNK